MLVKLHKRRVDTTCRRFIKLELIDMCCTHNIPTTVTSINVTPGWRGKPIGMLQISRECGHIDSLLVTKPRVMQYSKNSKKVDMSTDTGEVYADCNKYSLTHPLSNCKYCVNQKTGLEELANELSMNISNTTTIIFSPKIYCKLVGERINYAWGHQKICIVANHYHSNDLLLILND